MKLKEAYLYCAVKLANTLRSWSTQLDEYLKIESLNLTIPGGITQPAEIVKESKKIVPRRGKAATQIPKKKSVSIKEFRSK